MLWFLAGAASTAAAQSVVRLQVLDTAAFRSPRVVESSGVTPSSRRSGVWWTHNDSGDEPRLYATDSAGDDLGSVLVAGARNLDWEDLAGAPCPGVAAWCLYAADIGDNTRSRDRIVIYRIPEPEPPLGSGDTLRSVAMESALALRYPDRPHNAEAIVVDSAAWVTLITKEVFGRPRVYRAPWRVRQRPGEADTLRFVGLLDLPPDLVRLRVVTGAALAPDGWTLAVRTYSSLHFFRLRGDSLPEPLTSVEGLTIPFVEPQGEGIAFLAPDLLALTSERGNAPSGTVARVRVTGLPTRAPQRQEGH